MGADRSNRAAVAALRRFYRSCFDIAPAIARTKSSYISPAHRRNWKSRAIRQALLRKFHPACGCPGRRSPVTPETSEQ